MGQSVSGLHGTDLGAKLVVVGLAVCTVGKDVGARDVGSRVGERVGSRVGEKDGEAIVGLGVGEPVGDRVIEGGAVG